MTADAMPATSGGRPFGAASQGSSLTDALACEEDVLDRIVDDVFYHAAPRDGYRTSVPVRLPG
jgi:hypothetical protein